MPALGLKPNDKQVTEYYAALEQFEILGVKHETAVRTAFHSLLETCAKEFQWTLVPEYPIRRKGTKPIRVDGALLDGVRLPHGYWEAKDTADDLEREIRTKFADGYPGDNILFQSPKRAILYQSNQRVFDADLTRPQQLVDVLRCFLEFQPPQFEEWEQAVEEFASRVPELAASLIALIDEERITNREFIAAFEDFVRLCRSSLNPNLSGHAVEEMLIQHILTERIFRKIFDVADFMQRNVIAIA